VEIYERNITDDTGQPICKSSLYLINYPESHSLSFAEEILLGKIPGRDTMNKSTVMAVATLTMFAGFFFGSGLSLINDVWLYEQVLGTEVKSKAMIWGRGEVVMGFVILCLAGTVATRNLILRPEN
jgi:hypothetical protein